MIPHVYDKFQFRNHYRIRKYIVPRQFGFENRRIGFCWVSVCVFDAFVYFERY